MVLQGDQLVIVDDIKFNDKSVKAIREDDLINDYPVLYLLRNDKDIYIGETANFQSRMYSHLKNPERKNLKDVCVIGSETFNKSATFNIETNLINGFIADNKFRLQNKSQKSNKRMHNYHNKKYYDDELFSKIWDYLLDEKIVNNQLDTIKNMDVYKLSPYKSLSAEQILLKKKVITFCEENINKDVNSNFLIQGDAGTGKSVVISSIFNTIQDYAVDKNSVLNGCNNYLIVNHEEMMITYKKLCKSLPNLKAAKIMKPTSFLNGLKKGQIVSPDIVVVDEAHLLLTRADRYNGFLEDNQLEEIIKRAKVTVIIYDPRQFLKIKSYWNKEKMDNILANTNSEYYRLERQFRMNANTETLFWINSLLEKDVRTLPKDVDKNFELRVFDDCLEMYDAIKVKNKEVGLSRVVSTFDFAHKKDGEDYYVEVGDFKLPWNRSNKGRKVAWSEAKETINEVGSIYTIQGFDLNYVGVIIGPSIIYDTKNNKLIVDPSCYKDVEAFRGDDEFKLLPIEEQEQIKEQIILNSLNVLLKRGIKGTYICFSRKI